MYRNLFVFCFCMLSFICFAQKKVNPKQVEDSFELIFKDPENAIEVLLKLEQDTKNQKDSLHSVILNHIGVYYAVKSDLTAAGSYFDKSWPWL